jgi:pimeloyl-ACP methyl ester carboxylesterase
MDQRGTGGSGAIDCPALQEGVGDYADAAGDCAESLAGAANAYGTAAAADDLAAILDALDVPRVVVYGDSYGTYLAQVFAIRHPDRTAAVVLDAAYDDAFDPFARDAAAALERSWATLCRRAGTCAGIVEEIAALARRLERRPLVGTGVDSAADRYRVELTASALAQLLYDATYVFTIYRDFPAALGALKRGDPEPMLRLAAEDLVSLGAAGTRARTRRAPTRRSRATTTRRSGIAAPRWTNVARSSARRSGSSRPMRSHRSRTPSGWTRSTSTSSSPGVSSGRRPTPPIRRRRPGRRTRISPSWS